MAGLGQQARLHSCPDAISLLSDLTVPGEIIMQTKRSFSPWIWDAQHSTSLWKERATGPLQYSSPALSWGQQAAIQRCTTGFKMRGQTGSRNDLSGLAILVYLPAPSSASPKH